MADGGKRVVTVELDADLLTRAEALGPDLAATVEQALRRYFPRPMTDEEVARYVAAANEHYDRCGLAGEDFLPV